MNSNWLLIVLGITFSYAQNCKVEPKCRISRIRKMKSADCFDKKFREFPQCLSSDTEIIDLSYNRIRKLEKDDLSKYSDLKMLYLSDNMIMSIHDDTFKSISDLNTLDLSMNGLSNLPPVVFHLPTLKSLYLGQNMNINIVDAVESAKPITSPLVQFDISYVLSEEPSELPDLGTMPFLIKYNISGNQITSLSTKHFAGLCSLKILDTNNVSAEYDNPCDCWMINNWLQERKVQFAPLLCKVEKADCTPNVSAEDMIIYSKCREKAEAEIQKSLLMKILIPVGVLVVILLIAVVYFVIRRRKQRIERLKKKARPQSDGKMLL